MSTASEEERASNSDNSEPLEIDMSIEQGGIEEEEIELDSIDASNEDYKSLENGKENESEKQDLNDIRIIFRVTGVSCIILCFGLMILVCVCGCMLLAGAVMIILIQHIGEVGDDTWDGDCYSYESIHYVLCVNTTSLELDRSKNYSVYYLTDEVGVDSCRNLMKAMSEESFPGQYNNEVFSMTNKNECYILTKDFVYENDYDLLKEDHSVNDDFCNEVCDGVGETRLCGDSSGNLHSLFSLSKTEVCND